MRFSIINFMPMLWAGALFGFAFSQTDSTAKPPFVQDMQTVIGILNANNITTVDPEEIIKMENGRVVGLNLKNDDYKKPLVKTLPGTIGKLTALRELSLSRNFLKQLPTEIGSLPELRVLKLGENNLKSLPESMKNLQKLESLDLRYNGLTSLPDVCMSMKNLKKLQLWGNDLETLPDGICGLDSLRELYLQRNQLKTLPACITRMKSIVYMDFNFNKLCNVTPELQAWLKKWDGDYFAAQYCR